MIRIISGKYAHRKIEMPDTPTIRPTQDRIREALFSALGGNLQGEEILDLFAGSGSYSFEALSRGAKRAVINDAQKISVLAIKKTAEEIKCTGDIEIIMLDYMKALTKLAARHDSFSLIILDPPYAMDVNSKIIIKCVELGLLKNGGRIVAEQEKEPEEIKGFSLRKYKYSYKRAGIYRKEEEL